MTDYHRFPPETIRPPDDVKPAWWHWAIAIAVTFGPTIALLWFVFSLVQPRIAEITRGLP